MVPIGWSLLTYRALVMHAFAFTISAVAAVEAMAEPYPVKPVTIVVGNATGGTPDILLRTLAAELKDALSQSIVVINRTGANGTLAVDSVRRAKADGYTLLFATMTTMAVNPHLQKDAKYNGAEDFEPIAFHVLQPLLWATSRNQPFRSLKDVVEYARKNPKQLFASRAGYGASSHLTVAALMARNNIELTIVGYTGSTDTYLALRRGDVQVMVDLPQSLLPRIQAGDVVPLAITSAARAKALPDVPTWIEQGVMDSELTAWYVYLAPKGTPKEIVNQLNTAINKIVLLPRFKTQLEDVGGIVRSLSPAQLRDYMREEHRRWGEILKSANIQPDA
jgi:tripartite-type tricarboxylate transporter receptor subunit TctC